MPKKAIKPAQTRTKLCHSGLSAPLPLLTPGRPLILTLAKHAIKHELPLFPQKETLALWQGRGRGRGRGHCHKGAIQSWKVFLMGHWGETSTKSLPRNVQAVIAWGSYCVRSPQNIPDWRTMERDVQITPFHWEGNWVLRQEIYFTTWISIPDICWVSCKMLRRQWWSLSEELAKYKKAVDRGGLPIPN
jgi:hypothetical protein